MSSLSVHARLAALTESLPLIQSLFSQDMMLAVTDLTSFVGYRAGKQINVNAELGSKVPEKSSSMRAIKEERTVVTLIPPSVYGIPVKSSASPVRDESGTIIGAIMIGVSGEHREELESMPSELAASVEELSANTKGIASGSNQLAKTSGNLLNQTRVATNLLGDTSTVLASIEDLAELTNILGINASIEAARAGNAGRGFKVVANEIRRMSDLNRAALEQAHRILGAISDSVMSISATTEQKNNISQQQAAATSENATAIDSLIDMSERLVQIARSI